jgi:APA family basic amino acid/polyamine antiporter
VTPSAPATSPGLARRLGPLDAAAIVVSNAIGGGILFAPPQVAANVPNPWLFLATWVAGGALAFAGAMAYAELAVQRPKAGGEYVYLDAAFGRGAAFLTGWTSFVAGFSGAIASLAVIFVFYLGRFVRGVANNTPLLVIPIPWVPLTVSVQALIAIAIIALMAGIHIRGVGPGRIVGDILAALKVTAFVLFIALGLSFGTGSTANLQSSAGAVTPSSWLLALVPVMFAYAGWNAASYVAEEIRDPARNVPLALGAGTIVVIAIFFFLNVLYLYVLPIGELAKIQRSVLDVVADKLLGARAGDIMGIVSLVSLAASISAMTIAGPRVYYAMARDGVFLPAAAKVHPRYQTPAISIVAQSIWSAVLVLSGGADALIRYTGFAVVLFSGVAVTALFVLRSREPNAPRPFKAFGYPIVPGIFAVVSLLIVANALYGDPRTSGAGVLIILAGLPVYWIFARRPKPARIGQPVV